jgi:hypothetical protein
MADNKEIRGPQDGKFVNLSEDYEVRYWTNRFNCSEEELRRAVERVGNSAEKVGEALKRG